MNRIVVGHYADPTSTRELTEISPEEFDVLCFSLKHLEKKYTIAIGMDDEPLIGTLRALLKDPNVTEFEKENIKKVTPQSLRKGLQADVAHLAKLRGVASQMKANNTTSEIKNISNDEFRVIIDAFIHYTSDTMALANLTNEQIEEVIKYEMNTLGRNESEVDASLIKFRDPEYKEMMYKRGTVAYAILGQINTPYEYAVYLDPNGNEADTSGFFGKNKQDQKHDIN